MAFVAVVGEVTVVRDFAEMERFGEQFDGGTLAQVGVTFDGDRAFRASAVLQVAADVVPQVVVECRQLRCLRTRSAPSVLGR
jgi:hypothetical protein